MFNYFCVSLLIQGNDVIHQLTKDKTQVLRVELQRFSGEKGYAEYSTFIVGDEQSKYKLTVAGYKGNISKHLRYRNIKARNLTKSYLNTRKHFFLKMTFFISVDFFESDFLISEALNIYFGDKITSI